MAAINIIAAFDMRDPAQRAALAKAWQFTPAERASLDLRNACARTDEFSRRYLTAEQRMALVMDRTAVPAGVVGKVRDDLVALISVEAAARRVVNGFRAPAQQKAA